MNGFASAFAMIASWLTIGAMGVSLLVLLIRYIAEPFAPGLAFGPLIRRLIDGRPLLPDPIEDSSTANRNLRRRLRKKEWALHNQLQLIAWVVCTALMSRLIIFTAALVGCGLNGNLLAFFTDFKNHWIRWDAIGYLSIADYGYTMDNQAYLVLMPFYPLLTKLFSFFFLGNTALAATVLSNLALIGSGWALHMLVQEKQGQLAARRAVYLLMFCPLSVFFSVPYAESLFLFLTLLSILLARRQKFIAAVLVGMLAAFTRLAGILTIIPVMLEVWKYEHSIHLWPRHKSRCITRLVLYSLMVLLISLGFFGYMLVNYMAMGDPLAFIRVQAESWNQTFGSLGNTIRYSIESMFRNDSAVWMTGVWLPQSALILLAVALLLVISIYVYPADGLYAWCYLTMTLAPTWLLTGPRMILCMYALYPMLSRASRKTWVYGSLLALSLLLMIVCSYMYAVVGNIL